MDTATLLISLVFSCIGLGYFLYGKKQKRAMPFACGIGLMLYPYVISHKLGLVLIGLLLTIIPLVARF